MQECILCRASVTVNVHDQPVLPGAGRTLLFLNFGLTSNVIAKLKRNGKLLLVPSLSLLFSFSHLGISQKHQDFYTIDFSSYVRSMYCCINECSIFQEAGG